MNRNHSGEPIGSFLIGFGMIGLALLFLASQDSLPFRWQQFIRGNAPIWFVASAFLIFAGVRQLWQVEHAGIDWTPTRPGPRFRSLVLYTRNHCPLCDEATEVLTNYQRWLPPIVEVEIDDDPELVERYGDRVPVIEIDGRPRFWGHINEVLLQRLIEGTPPQLRLRQR